MKKFSLYFFVTSVILSTTILISACSKNSDDDDDLVGNWKYSNSYAGDPRSEAVSFVIGDKVYVGTGVSGSAQTGADRYSDFFAYTTSAGGWTARTEVADFPDKRSGAVAFAVNGMGYVGTGTHGTDVLKDFYRYDPTSNTWTARGDIADITGDGRRDAVAFVLGNRVFVGTGYSTAALGDLWEYLPGSNSWTPRPSPIGKKREKAQVFVLDNKAYLISGSNNGTALNDLQVYDPESNLWDASKAKINNVTDEDFDDDYTIPRINAVAFAMNGKGYVTCGVNGGNLLDTWEYDAASDRWTKKTSFEQSLGREGAIAFVISGRAFVTLGRNGSQAFDDTFEWEPNAEQNDDDN